MYILDFCNFSASSSKARSGLFTRTGFFYNLRGRGSGLFFHSIGTKNVVECLESQGKGETL